MAVKELKGTVRQLPVYIASVYYYFTLSHTNFRTKLKGMNDRPKNILTLRLLSAGGPDIICL